MSHSSLKLPDYDLSQEPVSLEPDFPIHLLSYSDPQEPITGLHNHNVLELGVCLRGNGIFIIGSSIHPYEKGDMIAIGPGVYHRAKSGIGTKDFWHFFYFHPAEWCIEESLQGVQKLIKQSEAPHLHSLMQILSDEIQGKKYAYQKSIAGLLQSICVCLSRLKDQSNSPPQSLSPSPGMDKRIAKAIDLITSAKERHFRIRELAKKCCLSESHFRHIFKQLVGMSPKQFQTKLKINMAMDLLQSGKTSVLDISYKCGFESLSSFNRHFKNQTGLSPLQWRNAKNSQTLTK